MATVARIDGDLAVNGLLTATSFTPPAGSITNTAINSAADIDRTKLLTETKSFPVDLSSLVVWDLPSSRLPATSSSDDLGLYNGTFATSLPLCRTYDVKNAGSVTMYARFWFQLPAEYYNGGAVTIRASAGMVTTVASSAATLDFEAYKSGKTGSVSGSDLVTTSATSINSLTFANKSYTVSTGTLNTGDVVDVRVTIAANDSATVTAVIAAIANLEILCEVKG